jgi:hypothetical protein
MWSAAIEANSDVKAGEGTALRRVLHGVGAEECRQDVPQPTQRRLKQGHRPHVGIAYEEELQEVSCRAAGDRVDFVGLSRYPL